MSGEFGWIYNCWSYWAFYQVAEFCTEGEEGSAPCTFTKDMGALLMTMYPTMKAIAYTEACDSSEKDAANQFLEDLPDIRKALADLEAYAQKIAMT